MKPDVHKVIASYENWMRSFVPLSFIFRNDFGETGNVNYDGENIRVIQNLFRGNQRLATSYCESVCFKKQYMLFEIAPDEKEPSIISALSPTEDDLAVRQFFRYGFIFGIVPYDNYNRTESIADLLKKSTLTATIHGNEVILKGQLGHYRIESVFIPEFDYALKSFSSQREYENTKLSIDNVLDIVSYSVHFENFIEVDKVYLPSSAVASIRHITTAWKKQGNDHVQFPIGMNEPFVVKLEFSDYQRKRKFTKDDFSFTKTVPNNIPVYMQDIPHIDYVWLNGKIVPWTNELALAQLRGHGFIPGVREPRFWLMFSGIVMIILALGAKIREYYKKGGGSK